tara:strand:- start:7635 stop:9200 length:1566 start_codon:yes stop_codon:yes gene_type:complete
MADNRIRFIFEINDAGKAKVQGLTKDFVSLDTAINKVNVDLKKQAAEMNKTSKSSKNMIDKTGLAGATLVELSRTISDSNYGFTAMANNISQLSTLFITLIATSGGVVGGIKQLGKAFLGPLGLIVLFNIFIAKLEKSEMNSKKLKKSLDALKGSFTETAADLDIFVKLVDRGNLSGDELQRTLFAITKRYKDLNPEVDENGKLTQASRDAIEDKIKSLRKLAKAQAIRKELEKLEVEALDISLRKQEAVSEAEKSLADDFILFTNNRGEAVRRTDEEAENRRKKRIQNTIDEFKVQEDANNKRASLLFSFLEKNNSANEAFGMLDRKRQKTANEIEAQGFSDLVKFKTELNAELIESDNRVTENKKNNYLEEIAAIAEFTNSMANFLGEQSAAGKAFAIATATMDAYVGANAALTDKTLPTVARFALAAAAVVQGLANVKNILAVKVPGSKGAGTLSASKGAGTSQAAPIFNVVGQSNVNQIGEAIARGRNQPLKAFVVGSEVTSQQDLDNKIINSATIG